MNISYEEVTSDSRRITEAMLSSKKMIPPFFKVFGFLRYQVLIYIAFAVASFLSLGPDDRIEIWLSVIVFGLLHWFFLFIYLSSYMIFLSVIEGGNLKDLKLVRIISVKIKVYGCVWAAAIFVLGVVSVSTELNVAAIVIGNFILSIFGLMVFNFDVSRFQIPSLVGALAAAKENLSKRN